VSSLETAHLLRQKLASMAMNGAYSHLIEYLSNQGLLFEIELEGTYRLLFGASCQSSGKFLPGCGQAGHKTVHSTSPIPSTPSGSCPWPAHLIILRWHHS
jgi:hypothetical protein